MGRRGPLLERSRELHALDAALERGVSAGGVVMIEGPAGIGKSRLIDAVRDHAAGFEHFCARGGALEGDLAFGVVRQLLEPALVRAGPDGRARLLAGAAAPAAEVLGPGDPGRESMAGLPRSLHALFWFVANLAEEASVLLVVDDLHWADRASLDFLVYLAGRIEGLPVLLLGAVRDGEPRVHEAPLAELADQATVVRPRPLTSAGVEEMLRLTFAAAPSSELVDACLVATGGNPFYLGELLTAIAAPSGNPAGISIETVRATVPTTVARSILLRLGQLAEPAPQLATAAALLGDGAALRYAAALAGVGSREAEAAADALVRASILTEVHPLRFTHPIVRGAVTGDSLPAERAAAHRRAAQILRDGGEPLASIVPHLLHSSPEGDPWVVETLHRAAGEAMARGVPDVAASYLRRALEEPPTSGQAGLLAELSVAELASGAFVESAATASRTIEAEMDPVVRARFRLHQLYAVTAVEGAPAGLRCLEEGVAEASGADPELALLLEGELAYHSFFAGVRPAVLERLDQYRDLPGVTRAERVILSVLALDLVRRDGQDRVVREVALRALAGGRLLADDTASSMAYYGATVALLAAESYGDAREAIAAGRADCATRGAAYGFAGVCWMAGLLALAEGNLPAAEADERLCAEHAVPTMVGIGVASLTLVLLEQGDVAGAERELESAGLLSDDRPLYVWGPYVRGCVRLAQGHPADALSDFRDVERQATQVGGFAAGLQWGAQLALALHALGDHPAARDAAEEELDRAGRRGGRRRLGVALRTCGAVTAGDEQLTRFSDAVEVLERSPAKLELARARFDLGVALLRAGRRRSGRDVLEKSYDGARACGARGLAQAAHDELRVAGARPRRLMFSGVESLTASERRVAEMAADGLTNREIATALFVTPKTVENHLGRVYTKLALSSRRQLREALRRASSEATAEQG